MRYRITCLTPTLVGDGERLSPIDYMVWKDQVNVLDQMRIFRLLARGPRLDGYLSQLKRAEKLDFASWGGFAQNYAGRRIPFEHASSSAVWERARAENLFIPTFSTGPAGPYLPGSALKGSIRTALVCARATSQSLKDAAAKLSKDGRGMRQAANAVEDSAVGPGASNALRLIGLADSNPIARAAFKIYLLRVSTLESRGGKYELAWKQAPRGGTKKVEDSTPIFAEMAVPGTTFEGTFQENHFLQLPDVAKAFRSRDRLTVPAMFKTIQDYTGRVLQAQSQYAGWTGLTPLKTGLERLQQRHQELSGAENRCLLPLGWSAGFLSKTAFLDTKDDAYRSILSTVPYYSRAIQSNLPFPKTRRIVFLNNQPAALAGFVELELM
ncbi:MAG: type III-A CRISPR-associated RAMP protein Csm5 [Acidobacteriaceae bacterium]|nr:type III-A CRISPR-associated RAMP protein Csm5 [Acidobacteriaceae bacterium]